MATVVPLPAPAVVDPAAAPAAVRPALVSPVAPANPEPLKSDLIARGVTPNESDIAVRVLKCMKLITTRGAEPAKNVETWQDFERLMDDAFGNHGREYVATQLLNAADLSFSAKVAILAPFLVDVVSEFTNHGVMRSDALSAATTLFLQRPTIKPPMKTLHIADDNADRTFLFEVRLDWNVKAAMLANVAKGKDTFEHLARDLSKNLPRVRAQIVAAKIYLGTGELNFNKVKAMKVWKLRMAGLDDEEIAAIPYDGFWKVWDSIGWIFCWYWFCCCCGTCDPSGTPLRGCCSECQYYGAFFTCTRESFRDYNTISRALIAFINATLGIVLAIVAGVSPALEAATLRSLAVGFGAAVALLQLILGLGAEIWVAAATKGEAEEDEWRKLIKLKDPDEIVTSSTKLIADVIAEMKRAKDLMKDGPEKDAYASQIKLFEIAYGPYGTSRIVSKDKIDKADELA